MAPVTARSRLLRVLRALLATGAPLVAIASASPPASGAAVLPAVPLEGVEVSLPDASPSGRARALVWAADTRPLPSKIRIVSPGALVPASAMATFARTLAAREDALVIVVDFDWAAFRESPAEQAKPYTFARAYPPGFDVEIFGHSAGGAVLAPATDDPPANVRRVVLFGVSRLFAAPAAPRVPVRLVAGDADGLVNDAGLADLARMFSTGPVRVRGVNHFCIVDGEAGSPDSRAQDGATSLDARACAERVVRASFPR